MYIKKKYEVTLDSFESLMFFLIEQLVLQFLKCRLAKKINRNAIEKYPLS